MVKFKFLYQSVVAPLIMQKCFRVVTLVASPKYVFKICAQAIQHVISRQIVW